jgi:hypothetical protein
MLNYKKAKLVNAGLISDQRYCCNNWTDPDTGTSMPVDIVDYRFNKPMPD